MMLMVDGQVTGEDLMIPECVHTISLEWYSSDDRVRVVVPLMSWIMI